MSAAKSKHSLSELSDRFDLELQGDGKALIDGVGTLSSAGPTQIAFLANPAYRKQLPATHAGAVILCREFVESCPTHCLVAEDPYLAYARLAVLFDHRLATASGIHTTAVIADSAQIGSDVSLGPHVVIGDHCVIGDGCSLGPGTVLEADCHLGPGCRLFANVSLGHGVRLGARTIIHPGAVVGADGFGIAFAGDHWEKVPQLGSVVTGQDCEIGSNTCIDRGALGDTVLEDDVHIDNLCQIAHNVHTAIAGNSGVAGSTQIGKYCLLGGGVGVSGHLTIADRTTIAGGSEIFRSITEPGTSWSGNLPSLPAGDWNRNLARFRKLDELARNVRAIELKLGKMTEHEK